MKTHLIITQMSDLSGIFIGILQNRAERISFEFVEKTNLSRTWNRRSLQSNVILVAVDYPIQSNQDADVVFRFVESVKQIQGNLFYAPRPNSFINVQAPALFGMYNPTRFNKNLSATGLNIARNITRRLPRKIKNYVHAQKLRWERHRNQVSTMITKVATSDIFKPSVSVPEFLRELNSSWHDWRDKEALKRDLIDRNHLYFPHPISMHVAVLNKCNLKCVMCPYHSPVYKDAHMSGYFALEKSLSLDTFKKLAKYAGERSINLQFGQIEETLLHPNIFDFISIAKAEGVPHIHLTTNGTLLTKEKAKRLVESGIDSVMFSVDSVDPEMYKKIRGASLNKLERNIDYFLPLAKDRGIRVVCSFILQESARSQQDAFLERWKERGVDAVIFYVLSTHDLRTGEIIRTEQFRVDDDRYPCASPWVQTAIMPDGSVGLCCKTMTDVGWKITSVGNINTQGFDEIWDSDRYKTVRKELLDSKFEEFSTCKQCAIWSASTNLTEYGKDYVRTYNETMETITFIR